MRRIRTFFFCLSFFFPFFSYCQNSFETYYDYNWRETFSDHARFYSTQTHTDSGWYRRDFFINLKKPQMVGLFEDKENKLRNGTFYYFYPNGNIQSIGKYIHNKREGLWLNFYSNGTLKDSFNYKNDNLANVSVSWYKNGFEKDSFNIDGNGNGVEVSWFDNGQPSTAGRFVEFSKQHGQWQYFHKNGKLSSVEVYDHGTQISKQYFDEHGNSTDTVSKDREAEFPGGEKAWLKFLSTHLHFPPSLELLNSDQATVVVSGIINEEGKIIDAQVTVPFQIQFDEIALKAINKSPAWLPAIEHNRKVYYYFTQPISFGQRFD